MREIINIFLITSPILFGCAIEKSDTHVKISIENSNTRSEWRDVLNWPQYCDEGVAHLTNELDEFVGVDVYEWQDKSKLVAVTCKAGAYNQGEVVFIQRFKSNHFELLTFPQFKLASRISEQGKVNKDNQAEFHSYRAPLLWGNLKIDADQGIIINDHFYRGGGGCGVSTSYSLNIDSSPNTNGTANSDTNAILVSLNTQTNCEQDIPTSDWKIRLPSEYTQWITVTDKQ